MIASLAPLCASADRSLEADPREYRYAIIELAQDEPEFLPRELAVRYTDRQLYFVSENQAFDRCLKLPVDRP